MTTAVALGTNAPAVFGFRRGSLRQWGWFLWLLVALAMALLGDVPGLVAGLLLLGFRRWTWPPRHGAVVFFPLAASPNSGSLLMSPTPCLWLDPQRVVLGAPYRVIYRDELRPAEFARLRRLCRGLPA